VAGLGTIRDNGDIYVSTRHGRKQTSTGIIALRLDPDHKAIQIEHFNDVDQYSVSLAVSCQNT
jgi:hypothetical protein